VARNRSIGSDFDDFLQENALLEGATAVAIKRIIAWKIAQAMKDQNVTKKALAERMKTSRSQVDRLLDEKDPALTLETLSRAASALGRKIRFELTV
jgi:DNA-binding Xre family transcriptional regulator